MQYPPVLRPYPMPPNEQERLSALYAYDVLDTLPEPAFDKIVAIAARLFRVPIALVSLVDRERQWFKAKCGLTLTATERDLSFCTHSMLQDHPLVVCDATKDERFKDNPLVTGDMSIRFYVGAPLKTKEGLPLGSLCVIDTVPRPYPEQHLLDNLTDLAFLVVEQLGRTSLSNALRVTEARLSEAQRLAHIGYWERNLQTNAITWSDELYRLFGLPPKSGINFQQFQQLVSPRDLPRLQALVAQSVETGEPFIFTHQINREDGSVTYLESHGHVERDSAGHPLKIAGTLLDITDRVQADLLVKETNRQLERRVMERTQRLTSANVALLAEIKSHELTQTVISGQNRVLQRIAAGAPANEVFDELLRFGEGESTSYFVGLLFLKTGDGKSLRLAASPNAPAEVKHALSSVEIGPNGSCAAAAAFFGKQVVRQIDRWNWSAVKLLKQQGIQNVVAAPILGKDSTVLGSISFAIKGNVTEHQSRILDACVSLAAVVLLRDREQAALRASEQAVREAEQRLRVGLAFSGVAVWTWSAPLDSVTWSGPIHQIFGVPADALSSYGALREIMLPEDRERIDRKIADSVRDGSTYSGEFRIVRPDGSVRWIAGMGGAGVDEAGTVVQMSGVNFDITDRKLAEESLALSELHFRELADSMPQIVWTANAAGDFEYRNRRWYQHTGLSQQKASHQAWQVILHHEDSAPWAALRLAASQSGSPCEAELRLWDATRQQYRWHLARQEPILDSSGQVVRWYGTCIDIHKRKEEEIKLAESERELRKRNDQLALLFNTGTVGDFTWDVQTDLVTAHPSVWKFFGKPGGSGAGPSSWFINRYHPLDSEAAIHRLQDALEGSRSFDMEYRVLWPDGTVRWLASVGVAIRHPDGSPFQMHGLTVDVTERKTAQLRILESERQLREQADAMPLIVWRSRPDGQIDYCNTQWEEFTGHSIEQTKALGWHSIVHPDDLPRCVDQGARGFASRQPFSLEFRVKRASDGASRWFLARCVPFLDHKGELLHWFGTGIDIDDQKTLNERLESQVRSRTAELRRSIIEKETLLKELHHRVKNNLQVIVSLLAIQESSLLDSHAIAALRDSQQRVHSMALIHERLYAGLEFDEIDFGEYARTLAQELFSSFSGRATQINARFETAPVLLNIDQSIPGGLILNELVTNALKYAYPNGEPGEILIGVNETEAGIVSLVVADQGAGLPEGFDWTQSKSMGLSIVSLLAQQMGGNLTVCPQPGVTFTVEFPKQLRAVGQSTSA